MLIPNKLRSFVARRISHARGAVVVTTAAATLLGGCSSIKSVAIGQLGKALADGSGGAFAAEEDPEFAGQAIPFSLKLIESLIYSQPDNPDLLVAAASGFTQYAFVWVQQPADFKESENFQEAQRQRGRARAFYLRAHRYVRHALEVKHKDFGPLFDRDPKAAVATLKKEDIPLMYWSMLSLGGAVALGKTDPSLIALQPQIEALADRAYELDPDWSNGALHEFFMGYELARQGISDGKERARKHYERAVELTGGRHASTFVNFAEGICVAEQKKAEFLELLNRALAIDPKETPDVRLSNVIMQERARWLLGRVDDLFIE